MSCLYCKRAECDCEVRLPIKRLKPGWAEGTAPQPTAQAKEGNRE